MLEKPHHITFECANTLLVSPRQDSYRALRSNLERKGVSLG